MIKRLNPAHVRKIGAQFAKKKILVFGDVGVDKYTVGRVSRISPEAPIPVVEVVRTVLKLGLAANVADNIKALGGRVSMVGLVGKDRGAQDFAALLKERGIKSRYLVADASRQTTLKERVVAESQQVVRIDYETPAKPDPSILKEAWGKLQKAVEEADAVIIEDYAKGLVEVSLCRQLVSAAEERKIPVFVDPNARGSIQPYYGCTVLTPNTAEAEALSGIRIVDQETLFQAGYRLLEEAHAKFVIVTRGRDGMAIFGRGEAEPILIPTFARDVFDVSGAGDTTIATLALAMTAGADIVEAAWLANYAAGVVVGKPGTATTNVQEITDYIEMIENLQARRKKPRVA